MYVIRSNKGEIEMAYFTARTAKQLDAQIEAFNKAHPEAEITLNYGRQRNGRAWYVHGEYGSDPQNDLTFADVVDYANQEAEKKLYVWFNQIPSKSPVIGAFLLDEKKS